MSDHMTVIIVDDEPIAQDIIEKFVGMVPYLKLIKKCDNAIEALNDIQKFKPDLVFLDVQMPEMTGLEMLKILRHNSSFIVITTAFPHFAIDGFNMDVTDYLLKPIPFERFLKAVNKCYDFFKLSKGYHDHSEPPITPTAPNNAKTYIFVKEGKKLVQVCVEDIVMVKALKDYMELFLIDRKVIVHITMAKLEEILTPPLFIRVSRSCIVRKTSIKSIQDLHMEIDLKSEERIVIGNTYWEALRSNFKELF
ncbi:LytR/AlgR family response regulator transcription factor [Pedobacter caeni]|uniref:Two component transcriptional regulator, LytTR family n=1 Tax=Pedobacter caeni TaxID=288992 RepID=A0A1M5M4Y4_9SPHI|nr:response regulator transcription factor [Pedobacter caeni]SHG71969.1 two component transcriptional regulator, LytTR family [Pedobacter caeni]